MVSCPGFTWEILGLSAASRKFARYSRPLGEFGVWTCPGMHSCKNTRWARPGRRPSSSQRRRLDLVSLHPRFARTQGYCFIEYDVPEGALLALEQMASSLLMGRECKVRCEWPLATTWPRALTRGGPVMPLRSREGPTISPSPSPPWMPCWPTRRHRDASTSPPFGLSWVRRR